MLLLDVLYAGCSIPDLVCDISISKLTVYMLTSFEHLTAAARESFVSGIETLVQVIEPELIVCYGTRVRTVSAWSPFQQEPVPATRGEYDVLIVLREGDHRRDHEIIDMIERRNTDDLVFMAVVHRLEGVREALLTNSTFFSTVCRRGVLVYGSMTSLQEYTPSAIVEPDLVQLAFQWERWFGLSRNFLSTATESASRGWYALAAFMLHQAVEHACIAVVRVCMGYRPSTHSLTRLLRLVGNISIQVSSIFPCFTDEERELFSVLQRAYLDARYREVYNVSAAETAILIRRVRMLQQLAETFYENKRLSLHAERL